MLSFVLQRLDCGNAMLAGIPSHLIKQMQSMMNSAAQLVFSALRYDCIAPLLTQLHWLKVPEQINFKLAVLHQTALPYIAGEFHQSSPVEARHCLHSASSSSLVVRRTHCSTIGDRAFLFAPSRLWNTQITLCRRTSHQRRQCLFLGNV